jgi:hypothetical protein
MQNMPSRSWSCGTLARGMNLIDDQQPPSVKDEDNDNELLDELEVTAVLLVVSCAFFVVCCLFFVLCSVFFVVCCWLFVVCCLSLVVSC